MVHPDGYILWKDLKLVVQNFANNLDYELRLWVLVTPKSDVIDAFIP